MIGDILAKLGRGETLSTLEQQQIRLWGNHAEASQAFVDGIQNGRSEINALTVNASSVAAGKNIVAGFAGRFSSTVSTTSGASTQVTSWTTTYNDGFLVSGGTVSIPKTGIYQLVLGASFDAGTPPGVAYAEIISKLNGTSTFPSANGSIVPSFPLPYLTGFREALYNQGDAITVFALQNSTATVNCYVAFTIREVRLS